MVCLLAALLRTLRGQRQCRTLLCSGARTSTCPACELSQKARPALTRCWSLHRTAFKSAAEVTAQAARFWQKILPR